ncbi:MAG TPA: enolase C-terminal domain-like protein [Streptosporangiales bacterium]
MRIDRVDVHGVTYTAGGPPLVMSGGRRVGDLSGVVVAIHTDDGLVGWGEQTPFPAYMVAHAEGAKAALRVLGDAVLGADPRNLTDVQLRMRRALKGHHYARSAIDVACWDVFGKSVGLPVSALLGGTTHEDFPVIGTVGIAAPGEMRERAKALAETGYTNVQVKLGDDWRVDVERAQACLDVLAGADAVVFDANGNWRRDHAIRFVTELGGRPFVEQPCREADECLDVRRRTGCLLSLDESLSKSRAVLDRILFDGLDAAMLKLSRFGGITPTRLVRDLCQQAHVPVIIEDGGAGDVLAAASAHLAGSTEPEWLFTGSLTNVFARERLASGAPRHDHGRAIVPTEPGLGLGELDTDLLGDPVFSIR